MLWHDIYEFLSHIKPYLFTKWSQMHRMKTLVVFPLCRTRWRTILFCSCQMSWRSTWRTVRQSLFASTAVPLSRCVCVCVFHSLEAPSTKLEVSAASIITKGEIHLECKWVCLGAHTWTMKFNHFLSSICLSTSFIQARWQRAYFHFLTCRFLISCEPLWPQACSLGSRRAESLLFWASLQILVS